MRTPSVASFAHLVKIGEWRSGMAKLGGCCASGPVSDTAYDHRLPTHSLFAVGFDSFHLKCGRDEILGLPNWIKSRAFTIRFVLEV